MTSPIYRLRALQAMAEPIEVLAKGVPDLTMQQLRQAMGSREFTIGFELEIAINEEWLDYYREESVDLDEHRSDAEERFMENWDGASVEDYWSDTYRAQNSMLRRFVKEFDAEPKFGWVTVNDLYDGALQAYADAAIKIRKAMRLLRPDYTLDDGMAYLAAAMAIMLSKDDPGSPTLSQLSPDDIRNLYEKSVAEIQRYQDNPDDSMIATVVHNSELVTAAISAIVDSNNSEMLRIAQGELAFFTVENGDITEDEQWLFMHDLEDKDQLDEYFDYDDDGLQDACNEANNEAAMEAFSDSYTPPDSNEDNDDAAGVACVEQFYKQAFPGSKPLTSNIYHARARGRRDYDVARIEPDSSIEPAGAELISPIFSTMEAGFEWLDRSLAMISKHNELHTNESTGVHVNVGTFEEGERDQFDALKMMLLVGDTRILSLFNRLNNTYTGKVSKAIKSALYGKESSLEFKIVQDFIDTINVELRANKEKYSFANMTKFMGQGYIEFRAIGGEDYDKKADDIKKSVMRMLQSCLIALDPQIYRTQYLRALGKMLGKLKGADTSLTSEQEQSARLALISDSGISNEQGEITLQIYKYCVAEKLSTKYAFEMGKAFKLVNELIAPVTQERLDNYPFGNRNKPKLTDISATKVLALKYLLRTVISFESAFENYKKEKPLTVPFLKAMRAYFRQVLGVVYADNQAKDPVSRVRQVVKLWRKVAPTVAGQLANSGRYGNVDHIENSITNPPDWYLYAATGMNRYLQRSKARLRTTMPSPIK